MFHSDVPAHRVAWASPAADPETGNGYTLGDRAMLGAVEGRQAAGERSLNEEFGSITMHGGRTTAPIVEGDSAIVTGLNAGWGALARTGNRYFAFNGAGTGAPGPGSSSPQDDATTDSCNYSTPIAATVNGTRLILVGCNGARHGSRPAPASRRGSSR